jgi:hypothetical protein
VALSRVCIGTVKAILLSGERLAVFVFLAKGFQSDYIEGRYFRSLQIAEVGV